jgi:hypothetical protein
MKIRKLLILIGMFAWTFIGISVAGELLVSHAKPVSICYTGAPPAQQSSANPQNIVDGDICTWICIDGLGSGHNNAGTFLTISLGSSFSLSRFHIRQAFDQNNPTLRVRGYQIQSSDDSVKWMTIINVADNLLPYPDTTLASAATGKYVRLVITKVDSGNYQTCIAEFEVYANVSVPAIVGFWFGSSSFGKGYRGIIWSTMNMKSTDSINIYYRPVAAKDFLPLALNELNDGSYDWKTSVIPDGAYEIKLVPVTTGASISNAGICTLTSFTSLSVNEPFGYWLNDGQQQPYPPPPYYSSMLNDTIHFSWDYQREYVLPYSVRLSYSTDNKTTWNPIITLSDTALRSWNWVMTNPVSSGAFGFFQMEIIQNGTVVNSLSNRRAMAISSLPTGVSLLWSKDEKSTRAFPRVLPPLLSYVDKSREAILLDNRWAVYGNGDTVSGMSAPGQSAKINSMACGSTSVDGKPGFVFGYINEESMQYSDVDKDGIDEFFWGTSSEIISYRSTGEVFNTYLTPGAYDIHSAVGDLDGDGEKEIVFTDPAASSIAALAPRTGISKNGFPVKLVDQPQSWTLIADLDGNGQQSIITSSPTRLLVLNADGTMRKGFPLQSRRSIVNKTPVLADIDNDGRLDIIFVTMLDDYSTLFGINIIDPDGKSLPGWPDTISTQLSEYPGRFYYSWFNDTLTTNVFLAGTPSSPLVVSMDGGRSLNIVMSCTNGFLYALNTDGTMKRGYPMYAGCDGGETGVFGDFDGNGTLNYAYHTFPDLMKPGKVVCLDFGPGSYSEKHMPWPMYLQNARRSGIAPKPYPVGIKRSTPPAPSEYALDQNYPNPFNPVTTISYSIAKQCRVRLEVYDVLGRTVTTLVDEMQSPGNRTIHFDASQLSSGVYFYRLNAGDFSSVKKMMVQK